MGGTAPRVKAKHTSVPQVQWKGEAGQTTFPPAVIQDVAVS